VNVAERFGANLARCRRAAGLSQESLSFQASLHRNEIGHLERGERLARADTVVKLAGALDVDPGALFEGIEWRPGNVQRGRFRSAE
jgi:transcriptional regulator with XRE-family HTH domain